VPKPLDRVIHTMGWPLRKSPKYKEFGGSFIYRWARTRSASDGRRPRLH
jgi:electron-transferring-flavoprotein dehydrogenase